MVSSRAVRDSRGHTRSKAYRLRRALALPGLPPDLRARLLAQLLYNLVVAVRPDQAEQQLQEAKQAVEATRDGIARFTTELAEAMLHYTRGHFETALALIDAALRSCADAGEDPRRRLARCIRGLILIVLDRLDEALAGATEGIGSARHGRQAWARFNCSKRAGPVSCCSAASWPMR